MIFLKKISFFLSAILILNSCNGKLPGADAKKFPPEPDKRVKKNLEEGRGFRLMDMGKKKGGTFDFASSNELWRASLDIIDFMPLASANYSGGVIITDWYTDNQNAEESIKLTIRFLTNEIRSDAIDIKIFYRKCPEPNKCIVNEKTGPLSKELKKEILKLATMYKQDTDAKNFKEYTATDIKD